MVAPREGGRLPSPWGARASRGGPRDRMAPILPPGCSPCPLSFPSSSPAARARACGRCPARQRPSRSCRCPTATRCSPRRARVASLLPGVSGIVTVTNRDYYFRTKDVYAGLARARAASTPRTCSSPSAATPRPPWRWRRISSRAPWGRRRHAGARRRPPHSRTRPAFAHAAVDRRRSSPEEGALVTFGITPTHAGDRLRLHRVRRRRSRDTPSPRRASWKSRRSRRARLYLAAGNYVWNSGMFAFTPGHDLLAAFARYAPDVGAGRAPVLATARARNRARRRSRSTQRPSPPRPTSRSTTRVMEHAAADGEVAVVRGDFDWSDVGSWQAISELTAADAHGNRGTGERVRHRHARHLRPFRGPHRRHDRRRQPRHRRHARRRAGRARITCSGSRTWSWS